MQSTAPELNGGEGAAPRTQGGPPGQGGALRPQHRKEGW
jgi:hypothetical protein